MKILIGVHHFLPHFNGGAEGQAYRLAKGLIERGENVQVVSVENIETGSKPGVTWVDDVYDGIPSRRLFFNYHLYKKFNYQYDYNHPWIGAHFQKWLGEDRPDLFHLISGYLLTGSVLRAAQELSIPTLVSVMDFWFLCSRISMMRSDGTLSTFPIDPVTCAQCLGETERGYRLAGAVAPGLMKKFWAAKKKSIQEVEERTDFLKNTLNQTDRIISNSQFLMNKLAQNGIDAERIEFLRQGRDFPNLAANFSTPSSGVLRVLYMGQIAELKGVHVLLEACQLLKNSAMQVKVYGDLSPYPKYTERLRNIAGDDPRIELAGLFQGTQEVSRILIQTDILVVPSVWYENSPNVILEAFAHKVPVITSNIGGMAELVQHDQNGLLFEAGSPIDLARQLERLIDHPGLLENYRKAIPDVPTVQSEIDRTLEIYHELISGKEKIISKLSGVTD